MANDPRPDDPAADDPAAEREGELGGMDPRRLMAGALEGGDDPGAAEEERRLRAEIARRLPDLEVLDLLGRGGMGTVYKVRQRRLDRVVALKVLTPREELAPELAERFEREARTLAKLAHPSIVAIFDFGRDGSFCWLLMEYVEGTTLRQLLDRGGLEPRQALALVGPLCDALQYAHEQGIVHRDVKPENVLIDRQGRPKVADFGLAKLLGEPAALVSLTASRQVLGTLRYMAPEQLDRPLEVDHRADLYALGVVLYEMLTGEVPVGRFELPSERLRTPLRLDEVVLRSLEREPARRYQSAGAVKSDVEEVDRTMEGAAASAARAAPRQARPTAAPAGPPELTTGAWLAPLLVALAPLFLLLLLVAGRSVSGPALGMGGIDPYGNAVMGYPGHPTWGLLLVRYFSFGGTFALLGLACVVGWVTLVRLKRDWPARYGIAGAAIGAWFLPYALLYSLVAVVVVMLLRGLLTGPPGTVGMHPNSALWVGLILTVAGLAGFGLLVAIHRSRFLREVRPADAPRAEHRTTGPAMPSGTAAPARLAVGAWMAPVLAGLALPLLVLLTIGAQTVDGSHGEIELALSIYRQRLVWTLAEVFFLLQLMASCALGWMTLARIRRMWPALYGIAGSAIGAWFLPCALIWTTFLWLWTAWMAPAGFAAVESGPRAGSQSGMLLVVLPWLFLGAVGFALVVVLYRRSFLRKVRD